MKACVTGATGFLGAHVVALLRRRGHEVRVTYRDESRLERVGRVKVDAVKADVLDGKSLRRAFKGCDMVFHMAGFVGARPAERVWRINALSPRLAVEAAAAAGCRRVVLTSSVAAVGAVANGDRPVDEDAPYLGSRLRLTYGDAKHEGEIEAVAAAARCGIEVVIVNPAYVLGAPVDRTDVGETSTRIVGNYLRGRLPMVMDGGASICDARDVARGHLAAATKGKTGERYLLAGHNITWVDLVDKLAELSGVHWPLPVLPREVAGLMRTPERLGMPSGFFVDAEAFGLMGALWWASSDKAVRELGYKIRPLDETLLETIEWYEELIESGAFDDAGSSRLSMLASGIRLGRRVGMVPLGRALERRTGRRFVAGA